MRSVMLCGVLAALAAGPLHATILIDECPNVENYSFELPGTGKLTDWESVPGWSSDTVAVDSGVQVGWPGPGATTGSWSAFLYNQDPSVWQLTWLVVEPGMDYTLGLDGRLLPCDAASVDLQVAIYYDDAGSRTTIASETFSLDGDWEHLAVSFSSDDAPEAMGQRLGIEMKNISDSAYDSWAGVDTVCFSVVPEPMTLVLLGCGAMLLRKPK